MKLRYNIVKNATRDFENLYFNEDGKLKVIIGNDDTLADFIKAASIGHDTQNVVSIFQKAADLNILNSLFNPNIHRESGLDILRKLKRACR